MDTDDGLIVPVWRGIETQSPDVVRAALEAHKQAAHARRTPPEDLRGFTLMLSHFGAVAGRYGSPLVLPPVVAILCAGSVREDAVAIDGTPAARRRMPCR